MTEKLCPACRRWMPVEALRCPFCDEALDAADPDYDDAARVFRPDDETDAVGYGVAVTLALLFGWISAVSSYVVGTVCILCVCAGPFCCFLTWFLAFFLACFGVPVALLAYVCGKHLDKPGLGMDGSSVPGLFVRAGKFGVIVFIPIVLLGMIFVLNNR
jgi:hypothetical protein